VLAQEAADPRALPDLGPRPAGAVEEDGVQGEAPQGEAGPVVPPVLPPEDRPVGRDELHPAQGVGREPADGPRDVEGLQEAPGPGRDALPADLVARKAGGVEEEHVVPPAGEEGCERGPRGPAANHDGVATVAGHREPPSSPAPGRTATARRR
jgi:hypothetical protein